MRNQTNKKAPNNRGESKIIALLRSIWLAMCPVGGTNYILVYY